MLCRSGSDLVKYKIWNWTHIHSQFLSVLCISHLMVLPAWEPNQAALVCAFALVSLHGLLFLGLLWPRFLHAKYTSITVWFAFMDIFSSLNSLDGCDWQYVRGIFRFLHKIILLGINKRPCEIALSLSSLHNNAPNFQWNASRTHQNFSQSEQFSLLLHGPYVHQHHFLVWEFFCKKLLSEPQSLFHPLKK